jgi:hypothetical protein
VELSGADGPVGALVLTHMVPESDVGPSIEIENTDTRKPFLNMQKQSDFDVRIHEVRRRETRTHICHCLCPGKLRAPWGAGPQCSLLPLPELHCHQGPGGEG